MDSTTFVPARALAEQFQLNIAYIPDSREIMMNSSSTELRFSLSNEEVLVLNNQGAATRHVNCYLLGGVAYIPLRFAAENFNLTVGFDEPSGKIEVSGVLNDKENAFVYTVNEDLRQLMEAVNQYQQAGVIKLSSNDAANQLVAVQKKNGMNKTTLVRQNGRDYQVVEVRQQDPVTGTSSHTSRGISEMIDGQAKPLRLLGGESFFQIGNLGIDEYSAYCVSVFTKENIAGGCRYDIKKIGDTQVDMALFINENGCINRYITYGLDGNILYDFTVEVA